MLAPRRPPATAPAPGPDPLVSLTVAAMSVVCAGLLLAGILAVYDWRTPAAEAPLVLVIAAVAVATLLIDVAVLTARHARRLRLQ